MSDEVTRNHDPAIYLESDDEWFRCESPERRGDARAVYVWSCDGCFLGLVMDARTDPDASSLECESHTSVVIKVETLRETLVAAVAFRTLAGLATFGALSDDLPPSSNGPIGPESPPVTGPARTVEVSDRTGRTDPDVP